MLLLLVGLLLAAGACAGRVLHQEPPRCDGQAQWDYSQCWAASA